MENLLEGSAYYYIIDIAVVAVALILALVGAKKGAIRSIIGLCSTALATFIAYSFASPLAQNFDKWFSAFSKGGEVVWTAIAAIALFLVTKILLALIGMALTKIANSIKAVGAMNTLFGAVIGLVQAAFFVCAVLAILTLLTNAFQDKWAFLTKVQEAIDNTFFTFEIRDHNPLVSWFEKILPKSAEEALKIG